MSVFNDDRTTLKQTAAALDSDLSSSGFDAILQKAFEAGLNLDEILYIVYSYTDRTVRRYRTQDQLKRAANKDR